MISDAMFPQDKLFVSITKCFEQYPASHFRFIHGTATSLDHTHRTVSVSAISKAPEPDTASSTSTLALTYHSLIVATGASTPSPLLSLNTSDATTLKSNWSTFRASIPSATSIVITGGGPTAVETAGELAEHLNGKPGWFSFLRSKPPTPHVQITIVTSADRILPQLRPSLARRAETYLTSLGVTILKTTTVDSVTPYDAGLDGPLLTTHSPITITLSNGSSLQTDLYIPATGLKPNTSFIDRALLDAAGRLRVNRSSLRVESPSVGERVYAVGDATDYARPAVHNILSAVPVVGWNIKQDLLRESGREGVAKPGVSGAEDRTFEEDTRETQLVPVGKSRGVGAAMGYALPSWVVWAIKGRDYWLWTTGNLWSGKQWNKE